MRTLRIDYLEVKHPDQKEVINSQRTRKKFQSLKTVPNGVVVKAKAQMEKQISSASAYIFL